MRAELTCVAACAPDSAARKAVSVVASKTAHRQDRGRPQFLHGPALHCSR
jgi:hypothetical protein